MVIIDCDVHQGDGTAKIFEHDPSVFTFSIHGAKNYPFHKEMSDLDVALIDDADDATYLAALREALPVVLDRARADLAIYLAGADPYFDDAFGRMKLIEARLAGTRSFCVGELSGAWFAGGDHDGGRLCQASEDTADIHLQTVQLAAAMMRAA